MAELECSYLSDVELVSASQNAEDTLKASGQNERPFLQPISACELKDLMDSRFAKKTIDQAVWAHNNSNCIFLQKVMYNHDLYVIAAAAKLVH